GLRHRRGPVTRRGGRVCRLDERPPDARGRRPPRGRQPRGQAVRHRPSPRLARGALEPVTGRAPPSVAPRPRARVRPGDGPVKAVVFERSVPRFAAARLAGSLVPGSGARVGPLKLADVDEPRLRGPGWRRVRPRLAGICGSDLATVDGRASRYFEPIVSFPFVPGHEVVGDLDDGSRVVLEPVLGCAARGLEPVCDSCALGLTGGCERVAFGHLKPGLQTGYCADTGGGWSVAL